MRLSLTTKFSYGVGHVFNDFCASMWFTYMLIFFNKVVLFSSQLSGSVVLVGQIADGLATPFVGFMSDRGEGCRYGRRKTWHLFGTVVIICTFPFIFSPAVGLQDSGTWTKMLYYCSFIVFFQFAWAAVQISHLSLVPDLTPDEHERTALLAIRNSFTVIANMAVYLLLWGVLQVESADPDQPITPGDSGKFQFVTYTTVVVGTITSILFHLGVKERQQETLLPTEDNVRTQQETGNSTISLFTQFRLYQVAVLYMATRLFANISQTIFPLYLHDNLMLGGQKIAILPLVMYALSFVMSVLIKPLNKYFGRRVAYCFGAAVGIGVSVWVRLGEGDIYKSYLIYVVAGMYGISSSALLVTSLGITADLIGQDLNNGAFIYGLMSFCDKLSNGAFVMMIQSWPCFPSCSMHYRDSLAYVCGGAAVLGSIAVLTMCDTTPPVRDQLEEERPKEHEASNSSEVAVNA
uniref:Major facilitator superfamily (MFS) profile domain-containing protein n=1 Tax=Graphocephala atropunctata TaxID=36148 RepID=A0A1B6M148_9HEMI